MSLRVLTQVWEHSKAEGGDLLVLLALADEARDNGACYPGIARIAVKARMSERNVRYVLRRLEESGELVVAPGGGRANTNAYEIRVSPNLDLELIHNRGQQAPEERGQKFPKPCKPAPKRGQSATETLQPAAPEPYDLKATVGAGTRNPGPVAACFKAYQDGIRAAYNAEYPPSASANGKLAQLVKTLGAEPALAVVRYYLQSKKPFYVTRRHALEVLVKDATSLWLEIQQASGAPGTAPKKATGYLVLPGGRALMLEDYPVSDHLSIARRVRAEYANMIQAKNASAIAVQVGAERRTFTIQEVSP